MTIPMPVAVPVTHREAGVPFSGRTLPVIADAILVTVDKIGATSLIPSRTIIVAYTVIVFVNEIGAASLIPSGTIIVAYTVIVFVNESRTVYRR